MVMQSGPRQAIPSAPAHIVPLAIAAMVCLAFAASYASDCDDALMTIPQLLASCGIPGDCGSPLVCENREILLHGWIDHVNIFDKAHYPNLPYEKFLVQDKDHELSVEVWASKGDHAFLFKKVAELKGPSGEGVLVRGTLKGIDLPIMGGCRRWVRMEIEGDAALTRYEAKGRER